MDRDTVREARRRVAAMQEDLRRADHLLSLVEQAPIIPPGAHRKVCEAILAAWCRYRRDVVEAGVILSALVGDVEEAKV